MATGTDAAGQNAYTEIIAAPTGSTWFRHLTIYCETNACVVSIDGGTTDFATCKEGVLHKFDFPESPVQDTAIQAKNLTADSNYANLKINAW